MELNEKSTAPGSIFSQPWWLDAVAPGAWGEVVVKDNNVLLARLPFMIKKRFGFTLLTMPRFTPALGPWFTASRAKYVKRLSQQHQLMTRLIDQLPRFDYFVQHFHYSMTNWLPFYWRGFTQTTRYTYVIEDLSDLDAIWQETRKNIRTDMRKAQKQLTIRSDLGIDALLDMRHKALEQQGRPSPHDRELIKRIDHACNEHNCCKMFFAQDVHGRVHAAAFIVWDAQAAYYLIGCMDPELKGSGAPSLLLWDAIQFAATVTQTFDFEGSMIGTIERFFRAFGARQKPYFKVTKAESPWLKIGLDVQSWLRR